MVRGLRDAPDALLVASIAVQRDAQQCHQVRGAVESSESGVDVTHVARARVQARCQQQAQQARIRAAGGARAAQRRHHGASGAQLRMRCSCA